MPGEAGGVLARVEQIRAEARSAADSVAELEMRIATLLDDLRPLLASAAGAASLPSAEHINTLVLPLLSESIPDVRDVASVIDRLDPIALDAPPRELPIGAGDFSPPHKVSSLPDTEGAS